MKKLVVLLSLFFTAPAQAATILYSDFSSREATEAQGWELGRTQVNDTTGELFLPAGVERFGEATYTFANPLDLDNGAVTVTWFERWVSQGRGNYAERAKTFVELDIIKKPQEDTELKANIRPQTNQNGSNDRYYQLYLDPGFKETHVADALLKPPSAQINAPDTLFGYRMRAEKSGNSVLATLEYFANDSWQLFEKANIENTSPISDYSGTNSDLPLTLDIDGDLEGEDSFKSLQLRFATQEYAFFDSVRVEQDVMGSGGSGAQTVPESHGLLGLLGAAGLGLAGWRRSAKVENA